MVDVSVTKMVVDVVSRVVSVVVVGTDVVRSIVVGVSVVTVSVSVVLNSLVSGLGPLSDAQKRLTRTSRSRLSC